MDKRDERHVAVQLPAGTPESNGEMKSVASLTYSMLVGSGISICMIAVLGGFEALSRAFLDAASPVFVAVCAVGAMVTPVFVWFPQWDIVANYGGPRYPGPPQD